MRTKIILIAIILLAFVLRFYNLASNPPSLDWDEAGNAWNAYSIMKTGSDEYGYQLPITLRSFNDYKPAMYAYAAMLPIKLFGLNEFAIRFPSAFFGSLLPLGIFLLFSSLSFLRRQESKLFPVFAAFLTAINPWMVQFSRGAFEANLGLSVLVWGIVIFTRFYKQRFGLMIGSIMILSSVYAYHSNKFVAPVVLFIFFTFPLVKKKISWKNSVILLIVSVMMLIPFTESIIRGYGLSRLGGVAVSSENSLVQNLFAHFNFDFLFLNGDYNLRHHMAGFGLFYVFEAILMGVGLITFLKNYHHRAIFFLLFFVALLPAAVAAEAPHAIRSILSFPFFLMFVVYGFTEMIKFKWGKILLLSFYAYFLLFYVNVCFKHYPLESSKSWQYGYKQVAEYVFKENIYQKYDKIVMTQAYDQPYIYMLFYGGDRFLLYKNDGTFQNGFDKFEFKKINYEEEKNRKNVLLIGTENEIKTNANVLQTIYFLDGKVAFKIVKTK